MVIVLFFQLITIDCIRFIKSFLSLHWKWTLFSWIGLLLFIPSIENILKQNNSFSESIRQVIFKDYYAKDINERIRSGNQLVNGEIKLEPVNLKPKNIDIIDINPILKNKIAASQQWRCTQCYKSLQSDFSVVQSGALCKKCVNLS